MGLAAGLINTAQEVGGALGLAVAATYAFRRVDELTAKAHGVPALVQEARTTVFHDAFLVGACFAAAAFVVTLVLLPFTKSSEQSAAVPRTPDGRPETEVGRRKNGPGHVQAPAPVRGGGGSSPENALCTLTTLRPDGTPHVAPVRLAFGTVRRAWPG